MAERILIAEENDGVREALAARLRQGGAGIYEAADTDSAAEILTADDIDVAVIGMSGFGDKGFRLLKMCRSAEPPTEVILIVGKNQGSLAITGMKLGAFRDVQAPVHVESLREIISQACATRKKARRRAHKRGLSGLPQLFAAIAFAEYGEHDTADEIRKRPTEPRDED